MYIFLTNRAGLVSAIILLATLMTACGGAGGGSGSGSSTPAPGGGTPTTPTTPTTPLPGDDSTVPAATLTRSASGTGCTVTQLTGGKGDYSLEIKDVSWLQVVQQDMVDTDSRLAAKKETRVRIDVTTSRTGVPMPASAKMVLGSSTGACQTVALTSAATTAPTTVDRATLTKSYVGVIPAGQLGADVVSWQVAVDDMRASSAAAADRLYRSGTIEVVPEITENIVVRPITFQGQTGVLPSEADLKALLKRTYPHNDFAITYEAAITPTPLKPENAESVSGGIYTFSFQRATDTIAELDFQCFDRSPLEIKMDPNGLRRMTKCFSAWPSNIRFNAQGGGNLGGVALGTSLMSLSFSSVDDSSVTSPYLGGHWLNQGATVLGHEFGHVMALGHASCGTTDQVDSDLYPDGRIGTNGGGYDTGRGYYFSTAGGSFSDTMSYCGKGWTSDLAYRKVMAYKNGDLDAAAPTSSARVMARETGDHDHDAYAQQTAPSVQGMVIRFYKIKGVWVPRLGYAPPNAVASGLHQDASFISSALKGISVHTIESHYGELSSGPYFIKATPQALALVKGLLKPSELLKF